MPAVFDGAEAKIPGIVGVPSGAKGRVREMFAPEGAPTGALEKNHRGQVPFAPRFAS